VIDIIGPRLKNTLFLASITALISVPLALALGLLAALYRNSLYDRLINATALTVISFPDFFIAYILMLILAVKLGWLPSLAKISPDMTFAERLHRAALPVLTLTMGILAYMMRMTRASIIGLLASPYIEMAELKGVPKSKIILKHALPMPGRRSSTSSRSISPIWWSRSLWWRWCSSIPASARPWWMPCGRATFRWCRPAR
jgi:peptide/nickel transport system permease protein